MLERIKEAVTETFGEKCADFDANCHGCQAWAEVEQIEDQAANIELLREALRPFVEYVHDDLRKGDHRYKFVRTVEMGGGWIASEDFRRASAAIKGGDNDRS